MKHCIDCRFYEPALKLCIHPRAYTFDKIEYRQWLRDGSGDVPPPSTVYAFADVMRYDSFACGTFGKLFEPKEAK